MTIGERIKQRRQDLGLTQEELARRLGNKTRASVCTVERDKEDLTTDRVEKYAAALGIPQSYTERIGGWHPGSPIMKEIYQNPIAQFEEKFANQLMGHFGSVLK